MARIRSVHPGFFTDEAVLELTVECPIAIMLVLGLWCESDDSGAFRWSPLVLKARYLGATSADVDELLEKLAALNIVRRFDIEGHPIGVVRNFFRFQRPQKPDYRLPFTAESRAFAGFDAEAKRGNGADDDPGQSGAATGSVRDQYDSGTVAVQDRYATATGISPQRKEEGRKESPPPSPPADANASERAEKTEARAGSVDGVRPFAELTGANVVALRTADPLEAEARVLMAGCKVAADPDFSPIARLAGEPGITVGDIFAGLSDVIARDRRRQPKTWGGCAGWVRGAAEDRIAAEARGAAVFRARDGPGRETAGPGAPGCRAPRQRSDVEVLVEKIRGNRADDGAGAEKFVRAV